jgi:hypothetical protein
MKEVLVLLNNSNPDGASQSLLLRTLRQWLMSSPHSILLTPCIKAASRCLASLAQVVQVTETCIQVYFTACKLEFSARIFQNIHSFSFIVRMSSADILGCGDKNSFVINLVSL